MNDLIDYVNLIRQQLEDIIIKVYQGEYDPAETYISLLKLNNSRWLCADRSDAETIILITAIALNASYENMMEGRYDRDITEARRISMYFIRRILGLSQRKIAAIYKLKDHNTIKYHLDKANAMILCDPDFNTKVEAVKCLLHIARGDWII